MQFYLTSGEKNIFPNFTNSQEPEPVLFGPLEPEPLEIKYQEPEPPGKKSGAGAGARAAKKLAGPG